MIDPPRRIAAAVAGIGVALCVLGWYQIAGQPTVPQQLPYLASATVPGAVLLGTGLVLLLRTPAERPAELPRTETAPSGAAAARGGLWRVPDGRYLHSADCPLLDGRTNLIAAGPADGERADEAAAPAPATELTTTEPAVTAEPAPGLRSCPLCRAGAAADRA